MEFDASKPIFQQIADTLLALILQGKWPSEERIPSVRDIAVEFEVNPNTAMRSYTYLQERDIIFNKRGVGYFVAPEGATKALNVKREEFLNQDIPKLFEKMETIEMSIEELTALLNIQKSKK